jgi:uncharacterized metal-binding protein YceD (DUF177 family)
MTDLMTSPVSFPVQVSRLPKKGMPVTIEADEAQREALARVHSLLSVRQYRVTLDVVGWKKGGVKVEGRVRAEIEQACVVTLEPVPEHIDQSVSAIYLPEGSSLALPRQSTEGEIILEAEGDDGPEIFSGDTIDVGQLAEEFFALAINPYPRKAGANLPSGSDQDEEKRGPLYEKLRALQNKS